MLCTSVLAYNQCTYITHLNSCPHCATIATLPAAISGTAVKGQQSKQGQIEPINVFALSYSPLLKGVVQLVRINDFRPRVFLRDLIYVLSFISARNHSVSTFICH